MLSKLLFFASTLAVSTTAAAAPAVSGSTPGGNSTTPPDVSSSSFSAAGSSIVAITNGIIFSMDPRVTTPSSMSSVLATSSVSPATPVPPVPTETTTEVITATYIVIESPDTVTVTATPSTVTDTTTVIASPSPPPPPPPQPVPTQQAWAAPAYMSDLSAFNVSAFPGGQHNLNIVNGIPASASATSVANNALSTSPADLAAVALTSWDNSSSVLQLLYPENSVNPAAKPQGGAEFYATPLAMQSASNVSLEYSVFFPVDYDWVLGGKLPGLYGGHTGCSGGNNALTCFSTRLMWRPKGMGELYLYAPKAKQTHALCSDPQSVCDAAYGFSIGRGSFQYAAGGWTHVRQTVLLNTPGKQDGGFSLDVNGKRVIDRSDVFYRDVPPSPQTPKAKPTGILGPLLGGLLPDTHILYAQDEHKDFQPQLPQPTAHQVLPANKVTSPPNAMDQYVVRQAISTRHDAVTVTVTSTVSSTAEAAPTATVTAVLFVNVESHGDETSPTIESAPAPQSQPVGFSGIFFSTFFGGHEPQYATPKDQYTWFKDFAVSCQ